MPVGKWAELKAAALKGPGTLAFSVAVLSLAETGVEENPQSVLALYDGKSLVTQWVNPSAWVYETVVVSDNKSHNFVWRFIQGSDTTRVNGGSPVTNTSVQVSIGLQSASLADLDLPDGMEFPFTLTWNAGEVGYKTFLLPIKSDNTLEENEQFTLRLENPDKVVLTNDSCVVTILDGVIETDLNEELPYLVIDLSGGTATESFPVAGVGAVPLSGWPEEYKTKKLVLRRIDPGTFTMGSPEEEVGRQANEFQHNVTISTVSYVSVFPVTQMQWELVMGSNRIGIGHTATRSATLELKDGSNVTVKNLYTGDWGGSPARGRLIIDNGATDCCRLPVPQISSCMSMPLQNMV